ncbi:pectin acetylesterase 5 isoform X2 [Beta vulgaris subsp. vulgaris]|uniref:pectin acetylesterase 5 isoform X2 n=1 Tax=Beta vulgaris subsp. vulgaris TaxID=3555 RepID=UPI00203718FB|nr:pectin acetylesterase 5 isoform X2 [Beta vulgaris subsp. vulgaris]
MAILRQSALIWCRKFSKRDLLTASVGLTLILFSFSFLFSFSKNTVVFTLNNSNFVPLTLLFNAKDRGAFCLDGSLPGYHFDKGYGSGSSNWVLHIEGGGWCESVATCSLRKKTALGSSNHMEQEVQFSGILSSDPARNPDFFNWNKVKIRYCDGSSFAGHPESEFHNGSGLFFRGQLIWEALMDEFLSMGMSNARQALLSGCSAGGLATMIHCDDFRAKLPKAAIVKCLADASFFLDEEDVSGSRTMQLFYNNVGVAKSLPTDCVAKMDPSLCFFPRQIIGSVKTPLFLVNPAYDFWQIQHVLVPAASDLPGEWRRCRLNIQKCNSHQMDILQGFRNNLLKALSEFERSKGKGMFINSCFIHCQTWMETWHGPNSPRIYNKTIAETVGDWYSEKEDAKRVDCPFPCNPSCYNMDFMRS